YILSWLFAAGPSPSCEGLVACGDVNSDGRVNLSDSVYLLGWLFRGGAPPRCSSVGVRPGDVLALRGIALSPLVEENEVWFPAGRGEVRGLPVAVRAEPPGGAPSILDVVVPGGVSSGALRVVVRGEAAAAERIDAAPALMGYTLGYRGTETDFYYTPGGFEHLVSHVTLYGLNLIDAESVKLDFIGFSPPPILPSTFTRSEREPSGLDAIAFNLRDDLNDVRLPISVRDLRAEVAVSVRGQNVDSNRLMFPVVSDRTASDGELSVAAISSVKVPVGIVSGPVAIRYTAYERVVSAAWEMQVEFRASNPAYTSPWHEATPLADPESDGIDGDGRTGIYMGSPAHRSGHALLPGMGAMRTFIWDAENDPAFREMNEASAPGGSPRPRFWRVEFRLTPLVDLTNRRLTEQRAVTPPIVYYDLLDRPGDEVSAERRGILIEEFADTARRDPQLTTAIWGPPSSPGRLTAGGDPPPASPFGEGEAALVLEEVDPSLFLDLEAGQRLLDEYVEIDTDRMEIVHHIVKTPSPDDPPHPYPVLLSFLEELRDETGQPVENPGAALGELHLARWTIRGGGFPLPGDRHREGIDAPERDPAASRFRVEVKGSRPLVVRLSGGGPDAPNDQVVFHIESTPFVDDGGTPGDDSDDIEYSSDGLLDISGQPGGPGSPLLCPCPPNCGRQAGAGGAGGPGAGRGGDGGQIAVIPMTPYVFHLLDGGGGANDGGEGGATPAAVDPTLLHKSVLHGAPGGGGGHLLAGGDGEYGTTTVPVFQTPRQGRGGPPRGSPEQRALTAGSGGGGGGASISRVSSASGPYFTAAGGGGGGGGGAMRVVGRGALQIEGAILARGGDGGSAEMPRSPTPPCDPYPAGSDQIATGAPGGGGSGGSVVLGATGAVEIADCGKIDVSGGEGGASRTARTMNRTEGRGDGAPGHLRIESPAPVACDAPGATTGELRWRAVESAGVSTALRAGVGPGGVVSSARIAPGIPQVEPASSGALVLWEGARESLDVHAGIDDLRQQVEDPRELRSAEFLRFRAHLRSEPGGRESIESISLPYEMAAPAGPAR
ncbi:MAG: hypothetical protein JXA90_08975, partial [Planctomycetes bacterium]|nr:hypothetical protein [Planctomycetota bacterium]